MIWASLALAQSAGSFLSPGPLARAHADLDTVMGCTSCHAPLQGVVPARCLACHEHVEEQVNAGTGFHADKGEACASCHSDHHGLEFDLLALDAQVFDHKATGFELTGAHGPLKCNACHEDESDWTGLRQRCSTCHEDVHGADHSKHALLKSCDSCHQTVDWEVASIPTTVFDHTRVDQVDYTLVGRHVEVECLACHAKNTFLPTLHEKCSDCHDDPHRARMGAKCEACHKTPKSWRVPGFDHNRTAYVLEGQHLTTTCHACHKGHAARALPHEACSDCHQDVHDAQFVPDPCTTCHTVQTAAFSIPSFDHAKTGFPLRWSHEQVACDECHGAMPSSTFRGLAHDDCSACHEDQHAGRFQPTPCRVCHDEQAWEVADFDHTRTAFPLQGKHADVACESCHIDGKYAGLEFEHCSSCHHQTPHSPTIKPRCSSCHATSGFQLIDFDHGSTGFGLREAHAVVACKACHARTLDFKGTPSTCDKCHQEDRPWGHYKGSCDSCHQGAAWLPAALGELDHAVTGFALRGQHAATPCEDCHPAGQARGSTPDTCAACHRKDDPHRNLLGEVCNDCHAETTWFKTRFQHIQTGWPLLGLHRVAECSDCHAVSYVATPTDCWRCHESQAPADIEAHQSPFFVTCDECHNSYNWTTVRFAH